MRRSLALLWHDLGALFDRLPSERGNPRQVVLFVVGTVFELCRGDANVSHDELRDEWSLAA